MDDGPCHKSKNKSSRCQNLSGLDWIYNHNSWTQLIIWVIILWRQYNTQWCHFGNHNAKSRRLLQCQWCTTDISFSTGKRFGICTELPRYTFSFLMHLFFPSSASKCTLRWTIELHICTLCPLPTWHLQITKDFPKTRVKLPQLSRTRPAIPMHLQSYLFNMTRLGNEKKVILSRCHIFNNMTNWTWLSQ